MSRTMAVHVLVNFFASLAKQQREMTKLCVVWRKCTAMANFLNFYFNLMLCSIFR